MVALMLFPLLLVSKGIFSAYPYENKLKTSQKAMQENYLFTTGNVHWLKGQVYHQMTELYLLQVDLHLKENIPYSSELLLCLQWMLWSYFLLLKIWYLWDPNISRAQFQ